MPSRRLFLVRHAKSSWADPELADHDRPLNARGRHAATLVGRHLRRAGVQPDLVICSSATRAYQTLDLLDLATETVALIEDELYGAPSSALLARLRRVPATVGSVMLIGHNPGLEELARMLAGERGALGDKFPTAAVAELFLPVGTWKELHPGVGQLRAFITPRSVD